VDDTIAFLGSPVQRGERVVRAIDTGWACEALETASDDAAPRVVAIGSNEETKPLA
jgi:hypothetical protein